MEATTRVRGRILQVNQLLLINVINQTLQKLQLEFGTSLNAVTVNRFRIDGSHVSVFRTNAIISLS